jgi:predicted RNase H-related nuclease YkuK (DUF458 family)
MVEIMRSFYDTKKDYGGFHVIVGTDSQNFSYTKMVSVIVMQCEGHGGIYFYRVEKINRLSDVRTKLNYETQISLHYADELLNVMAEIDEDLFSSINFSIHVDAGRSENGKTKELIPSLVGWIHSYGYECHVKPDSFAASTIANRISK